MPFRLQSPMDTIKDTQKNVQAMGIAHPWSPLSQVSYHIFSLKNISLFFSEETHSSKMIKEAAIFCYSVVNSKSDLKFIDMLSSCEDLNDLKRN